MTVALFLITTALLERSYPAHLFPESISTEKAQHREARASKPVHLRLARPVRQDFRDSIPPPRAEPQRNASFASTRAFLHRGWAQLHNASDASQLQREQRGRRRQARYGDRDIRRQLSQPRSCR